MSDEIEAVIRQAIAERWLDVPEHVAPDRRATANDLVAGLAAAVRLLLESAELPAGWRAHEWRSAAGCVEGIPPGSFSAWAADGNQFLGEFESLAEAIAAVEAARSSGR